MCLWSGASIYDSRSQVTQDGGVVGLGALAHAVDIVACDGEAITQHLKSAAFRLHRCKDMVRAGCIRGGVVREARSLMGVIQHDTLGRRGW